MGITISWPAVVAIITGIVAAIGWIKKRSVSQHQFDEHKIECQALLTKRFQSVENKMNEIVKNNDIQIHSIKLEINTIVTELKFFAQAITNLTKEVKDQTDTIKEIEGYREGYKNGKKNS